MENYLLDFNSFISDIIDETNLPLEIMMNYLLLFFAFLFFLRWGCSSSDQSQQQTQDSTVVTSTQDTTATIPLKSVLPTTIKSNMTTVEAVVDTVLILDSLHYKIKLMISTVIPEGGYESLAENNQTISAIPGYVLNETGVADMNDQRNQGLFRLRDAHHQEPIKGKISLTEKQGWVLVSVVSFR